MNKAQRQPEELVGKTVIFVIPGEAKGRRSRLSGFRTGKVISVSNGPRTGWRDVTVLTPPTPNRCPCPNPNCKAKVHDISQRLRVQSGEIQSVIWFGKERPLAQWMAGAA